MASAFVLVSGRTRPIADSGHLLLILTSRDVQSVADLALASGRSSTDTVRSLGRLVDQGFLVVGDQSGTAVYQLRPKAEPSSVVRSPRAHSPHRR